MQDFLKNWYQNSSENNVLKRLEYDPIKIQLHYDNYDSESSV